MYSFTLSFPLSLSLGRRGLPWGFPFQTAIDSPGEFFHFNATTFRPQTHKTLYIPRAYARNLSCYTRFADVRIFLNFYPYKIILGSYCPSIFTRQLSTAVSVNLSRKRYFAIRKTAIVLHAYPRDGFLCRFCLHSFFFVNIIFCGQRSADRLHGWERDSGVPTSCYISTALPRGEGTNARTVYSISKFEQLLIA